MQSAAYPRQHHQIFQTNRSLLVVLLARQVRQLRTLAGAIPPSGFVLLSILAVQIGAALAKHLFTILDPIGAAFVRTGFAALLLLMLWRPQLQNHGHRNYTLILLCGLVLAGMNLAFYAAIARIPLGIASALEFLGPLGLAMIGSRRLLDLLWVVLVATGVILLTPISSASLDLLGVVLALLAGCCWATYILLAGPLGRAFPGGAGLALAMTVAAILLLPLGILQGGTALLNPVVLVIGIGVAFVGVVIPFSLEFEALKRLPPRIFGVLISVEPAIAALVGFILLGEQLGIRTLTAIGLVTLAAVGVTLFGGYNRID